MKIKICRKCKKPKSLLQFYSLKRGKQGVQPICKVCHSTQNKERVLRKKSGLPSLLESRERPHGLTSSPDYNYSGGLKHKYGITIIDYNLLFSKQQGKCAICETHQSELRRRLSVDHNHTTGKIRKLLCHHCNSGIGYFRENPVLLQKAINYILETN